MQETEEEKSHKLWKPRCNSAPTLGSTVKNIYRSSVNLVGCKSQVGNIHRRCIAVSWAPSEELVHTYLTDVIPGLCTGLLLTTFYLCGVREDVQTSSLLVAYRLREGGLDFYGIQNPGYDYLQHPQVRTQT